jgi:hypothetical protein
MALIDREVYQLRYFNLLQGDYMWLLEYFLRHWQDIDTLSKNPEYRV